MRNKNNNLAKVYHADLYGLREDKYEFLIKNSISSIEWTEIPAVEPNYFFVEKDFEVQEEYKLGFQCNSLFKISGVGMTTAHDEFVIKDTSSELIEFYKDFQNSERDPDLLHRKFNVKKKKGWNILAGYDNIKNERDLSKFIKPVSYRPFDNKYIFYEDKLVWRTVRKVMQHFLKGENVGLIIGRQGQVVGTMQWNLSFITNDITDFNFYYRGGGVSFPLYLYPDDDGQQNMDEKKGRKPNLNMEIVKEIEEKLGLKFVAEKESTHRKEPLPKSLPGGEGLHRNTFAPIDILDYIYAVLHSPTYREKYKEFLKIDFPRVPYPYDPEVFWKLVELGGEIRQIHLLESPKVMQFITSYPNDGDNVITRSLTTKSPGFEMTDETTKTGRVWINDQQYFDGVPEVAYNFYIGGYQPAQKWLKDRKGRQLSFEDIMHYQKIIVALTETDRIMREIDEIEVEGEE